MRKESKEFFKPEWKNVDTSKLPLKFGQIINFNINGQNIKVILLDFDKDEAGVWYGLAFINQTKIFGRQIPSGYDKNCVDLLDLTYLNEKGLREFQILKSESIDINKVGIGSISPVNNYSEILNNYKFGIEQRKNKQTPCNEEILSTNPVRECYLNLSSIK